MNDTNDTNDTIDQDSYLSPKAILNILRNSDEDNAALIRLYVKAEILSNAKFGRCYYDSANQIAKKTGKTVKAVEKALSNTKEIKRDGQRGDRQRNHILLNRDGTKICPSDEIIAKGKKTKAEYVAKLKNRKAAQPPAVKPQSPQRGDLLSTPTNPAGLPSFEQMETIVDQNNPVTISRAVNAYGGEYVAKYLNWVGFSLSESLEMVQNSKVK